MEESTQERIDEVIEIDIINKLTSHELDNLILELTNVFRKVNT